MKIIRQLGKRATEVWDYYSRTDPYKNSRISPWLIAFTLLILGFGTAVAQDELSVQLTAVRQVAKLGEVVPVLVTVDHPAGHRAIMPELPETWGDFEVRGQTAVEISATTSGHEQSRQTIDLIAWQIGTLTTMPLTITVSNPAGELTVLMADPVSVEVVSSLSEDDLELRDIKPQVALPIPVWWPWVTAAGVMVLMGLFWWHGGRQQETAVVSVDGRLPHELALAELDAIAATGMATKGNFKGHYAQTTDVVRGYFDQMLHTNLLEQTTSEARQAVRTITLNEDAKQQMLALLDESDLVKFAKVKPTVEDAERATTEAKEIIVGIYQKEILD